MPVVIEYIAPEQLDQADLKPRESVFPSPGDWRDQVFYFLLPDRFNDGQADQRPLYDPSNPEQFKAADKRTWMEDGKKFQGGKLKGIQDKLDYLKNLGVTTLWIGPPWRQRKDLETYHGYGIQNFLEIDPRFGTRQDLRNLVDAAHDRGMYVLLDIIYNHTGNNWYYDQNGTPASTTSYRFSPPYPVHGWRSGTGNSISAIHSLEDGVWPKDFQNFDYFTRAGEIGQWDPQWWEDPLHPDNEFRRGDFGDLKDLHLDSQQGAVLASIIRVYQYWIALSDCDGFRIDTVKHVSWEASRNFCGAIREYAESIGKDNFLLLGEVTGGSQMARDYLNIFGRNIDAVLDIGSPALSLSDMVKGLQSPGNFFDLYRGHDTLGSHRETGRFHVSILDDHDMIGRARQRFAAHNDTDSSSLQVAHAVGTQLTTLGVPCVYYGTEQAFDGNLGRHDETIEPADAYGNMHFADRYIRESMFGGTFGAFETSGCHFFNENHPAYLRIAAIAGVRKQQNQIGLTLRRGRQYQRETSFLDRPFSLPDKGELIAWSRLLYDQEVLMVLNTHGTESRGAYITVHTPWHPEGSTMTYLYKSDWSDADLRNPPQNQTVNVVHYRDRSALWLNLPPAAMVILA